jgi:predicted acyl esterase
VVEPLKEGLDIGPRQRITQISPLGETIRFKRRDSMKKDWHELISQPKHEVAQEKNVFVPMRDGVQLAVDIYRPKAKGKFPALLGLCPYGKELQALQLPPQPLDKT